MQNAQRILVGVCTYNEVENVEPLLSGITSSMPNADIVVIDDNSPDGTADSVRSCARRIEAESVYSGSIRCVVRETRGLGGAIRAAMNLAIEEQYDLFCNLDADLSHDPADLPALVAVVNDGVDVGVGSRYVRGGSIVGWPWYRRWMSGMINTFTRRLLRLPVRDASGSFRCYRVSALREVSLEDDPSEGYSFIQQILLRLHQSKARFAEVPICFTERIHGDSKLSLGEAVRSAWTVTGLLRSRS